MEYLADLWYFNVAGVFLSSYLQTAGSAEFLPKNRDDFDTLLQAFLLETAVYELSYELNNRPDWLAIPLQGIQHLMKARV